MPKQPLDEFGLPTSIDEDESLRDELWRRAHVKFAGEIALAKLFARLKFHLGLDDAQNMLLPFVKKQRGRPKGSGKTNENLLLLAVYNDYRNSDKLLTKDEICTKIFDDCKRHKLYLGNSPKAIATQINTLLKTERKRQELRKACDEADDGSSNLA